MGVPPSTVSLRKQRIPAMKGLAVLHGTCVGMDLDDPRIDFVALADSLGVPAERVKTIPEGSRAWSRALTGGAPALLDVELDRAFTPN